jgi:uncharacterized protein
MSAIEITSTPGGLLLPIRVQAGARRNHVGGVHDGRLKVSVTQAPERGKANREVLKLLASALGVRRSELSLETGETSPRKVIRVADLSEAKLRERLSTLEDT